MGKALRELLEHSRVVWEAFIIEVEVHALCPDRLHSVNPTWADSKVTGCWLMCRSKQSRPSPGLMNYSLAGLFSAFLKS